MPIKSFADIEHMISAYKSSKNSQSTSSSGVFPFFEGTYSRSSSSSSGSTSSSYMSRSRRVIGAGDMLDENGYFNSSRQLIK